MKHPPNILRLAVMDAWPALVLLAYAVGELLAGLTQ